MVNNFNAGFKKQNKKLQRVWKEFFNKQECSWIFLFEFRNLQKRITGHLLQAEFFFIFDQSGPAVW